MLPSENTDILYESTICQASTNLRMDSTILVSMQAKRQMLLQPLVVHLTVY